MNELNLYSIIKTRNRRQDPKDSKLNFPDLIKRQFKAVKPLLKLYTDVTYIPTPHAPQGYFYISGAIDGHDNSFNGLAMSIFNNTDLILDTFKQIPLYEIIVHSDHGSQYGSFEYQSMLATSLSKVSMGRRGVSLDNRPIEYF
jgi:transposase InsO family protein